MGTVSVHFALDVPSLVRIIDPAEHRGKLIMNVSYDGGDVKLVTDAGEVIWFRPHSRLTVEAGAERQMKLAWAARVAAGEIPPVADEAQVKEIADRYRREYDFVRVREPDYVGRVIIEAYLDDVQMRVTVVSPDGTVTPDLTPAARHLDQPTGLGKESR